MPLKRGRELLKLCGLSGGVMDVSLMNSEAEVHLFKSEYAQARDIYTHFLRNPSAEQDTYGFALFSLNIAGIDVIIGICEQAVLQNLNKAKTIFKTIGQSQRLADISQWRVAGFQWVYTWTVVYLAHAKTTQMTLDLHKALQFLGDVFLQDGDEETAHSLWAVALEGFTYMDVHRSRANCMLRLGDLVQQRGQPAEAVELWRNARPLFELSLQTKDVAQINDRLGAGNHDQEALGQLASAPVESLGQLSIQDTNQVQTKAGQNREQDKSLVIV
ncbi:hypothetical protein FB451DRAFT_1164371 [Mycena latifolia]|nr:hypothetical protein FB451DRAFT_1164371 [Mycena latifolia]